MMSSVSTRLPRRLTHLAPPRLDRSASEAELDRIFERVGFEASSLQFDRACVRLQAFALAQGIALDLMCGDG